VWVRELEPNGERWQVLAGGGTQPGYITLPISLDSRLQRRAGPEKRGINDFQERGEEGDRRAALEPIRQGVRAHMGGYAPRIALGLGLRHDWGPQYTAHQFQAELAWLGIRSTPSYVGEPECNGVAERFMRTLKEECLYLHDFKSLEEARAVIEEFIERYNQGWLLERHGYRTPAEARREFTRKVA